MNHKQPHSWCRVVEYHQCYAERVEQQHGFGVLAALPMAIGGLGTSNKTRLFLQDFESSSEFDQKFLLVGRLEPPSQTLQTRHWRESATEAQPSHTSFSFVGLCHPYNIYGMFLFHLQYQWQRFYYPCTVNILCSTLTVIESVDFYIYKTLHYKNVNNSQMVYFQDF